MPDLSLQASLQELGRFGSHQNLAILMPLGRRDFRQLLFCLNLVVGRAGRATGGRESRRQITIAHVGVEDAQIAVGVGRQTVHVDQLASF